MWSGNEVVNIYDEEMKSNGKFKIKEFVDIFNFIGKKELHKQYIIEVLDNTNKANMIYIIGLLKNKNEYNKLIVFECDHYIQSVTPDHLFDVKNKETLEYIEMKASDIINDYEKYELGIAYRSMSHLNILNAYEIEHDDYVYGFEFDIDIATSKQSL